MLEALSRAGLAASFATAPVIFLKGSLELLQASFQVWWVTFPLSFLTGHQGGAGKPGTLEAFCSSRLESLMCFLFTCTGAAQWDQTLRMPDVVKLSFLKSRFGTK